MTRQVVAESGPAATGDTLAASLRRLRAVSDAPTARPADAAWSAPVLTALTAVGRLLQRRLDTDTGSGPSETWLTCRELTVDRERQALLRRVRDVVGRVRASSAGRDDVRRLVVDLHHHHQRRHDLVYDLVSLELGGSE